MTETRPTFLFVHGAWHGADCWRGLRDVLEERGWRTEAIDLPTVHREPQIDYGMLDDAGAVRDAIDRIDGDVVVVAHSYGGVPTSQSATGPTVRRIVYIAAFALDEGESLLGAVGGVPPVWWNVGEEVVTPGIPELPPADVFYADGPADAVARTVAAIRPQSIRAFQDALTTAAWRTKPSTYVICEQDEAIPAAVQAELAARAGSEVRRMPTSHTPFLGFPEAVADLLEEAAG